jgi:hypothetical protein
MRGMAPESGHGDGDEAVGCGEAPSPSGARVIRGAARPSRRSGRTARRCTAGRCFAPSDLDRLVGGGGAGPAPGGAGVVQLTAGGDRRRTPRADPSVAPPPRTTQPYRSRWKLRTLYPTRRALTSPPLSGEEPGGGAATRSSGRPAASPRDHARPLAVATTLQPGARRRRHRGPRAHPKGALSCSVTTFLTDDQAIKAPSGQEGVRPDT